MSIVSLGLQCVRLARRDMSQVFERKTSQSSLKDLRYFAVKDPVYRDAAVDPMVSVKICLMQVLHRQTLKENAFDVFTSATTQELKQFCTVVLDFEESLTLSIKKAQFVRYIS